MIWFDPEHRRLVMFTIRAQDDGAIELVRTSSAGAEVLERFSDVVHAIERMNRLEDQIRSSVTDGSSRTRQIAVVASTLNESTTPRPRSLPGSQQSHPTNDASTAAFRT
jgi:hypothetical protein